MRSVVVSDGRADEGELVLNAEFLRFASHWGFRPRSCRPYRARTKGKVERADTLHPRELLLYGRKFVSDEDLNEQAQRWLEGTANVRRHGTTGERPVDRFERDEATGPAAAGRPSLSALGRAAATGDPASPAHDRGRRAPSAQGLRGGGAMRAPTGNRRDRLRAMLADLKMPGALEAVDGILAQADSGAATAGEAIEQLLDAQIALRKQPPPPHRHARLAPAGGEDPWPSSTSPSSPASSASRSRASTSSASWTAARTSSFSGRRVSGRLILP